MIGKRFSRLLVIAPSDEGSSKHPKMICLCDCGKTTHVIRYHLASGHSKSCGCLSADMMREKQTIHGRYYEPEYRAWAGMIKRCAPGSRFSKWYGTVSVCERWLNSYEDFLLDVGRRPHPTYSIDRRDTTGNYEPGNVRWADKPTQSQNTKTHCTNTSGVRGVSWSKGKQRWRSHISVNGKSKHLGYFDSIDEAKGARLFWEKLLWAPQNALI